MFILLYNFRAVSFFTPFPLRWKFVAGRESRGAGQLVTTLDSQPVTCRQRQIKSKNGNALTPKNSEFMLSRVEKSCGKSWVIKAAILPIGYFVRFPENVMSPLFCEPIKIIEQESVYG